MAYQEKQLQEISKKFQIYGEILHAETLKIGHINETYTATYDQGGTRVRYIHQKINRSVFKNPVGVMKNVMRVTTHIRKKQEARNVRDATRRSLVVIPARDGKSFVENGDHEVWRTFVFVEGVETYEAVQTPEQAFQAGRAFGEFRYGISSMILGNSIPNVLLISRSRRRQASSALVLRASRLVPILG